MSWKPRPVQRFAFEWFELDWGLTDEELAEGLGLEVETVRLHRPVGVKPDLAGLNPPFPCIRDCVPPEVLAEAPERREETARPCGKPKPKAKKKAKQKKSAPPAKPEPKPEPTPEEKAEARIRAAVRQVADGTVVVRLEMPKKLHDAALAAAAGGGG